MIRGRARLLAWAPLVVGVFAANLALPRAALVYHVHADGDRTHAHAHAEDPLGIADLLEDRHHHGHGDGTHSHAHANSHAAAGSPAAVPDGVTLAADDGGAGGHWHEQQRYQRALPATAPMLVVSVQISETLRQPPVVASLAAVLAQQARAPPASPTLS